MESPLLITNSMKLMRSLLGGIWLRKDFTCGNLTAGEKFGNCTRRSSVTSGDCLQRSVVLYSRFNSTKIACRLSYGSAPNRNLSLVASMYIKGAENNVSDK